MQAIRSVTRALRKHDYQSTNNGAKTHLEYMLTRLGLIVAIH